MPLWAPALGARPNAPRRGALADDDVAVPEVPVEEPRGPAALRDFLLQPAAEGVAFQI